MPATAFLGVRLSAEEVAALDRLRTTLGLPNRSEVVRHMVRSAQEPVTHLPELPVGLVTQLEEIVEDGWAKDAGEALTLVLTLGLAELSRLHTERLPALRRAARTAAEKRADRRRAERGGRGLLER